MEREFIEPSSGKSVVTSFTFEQAVKICKDSSDSFAKDLAAKALPVIAGAKGARFSEKQEYWVYVKANQISGKETVKPEDHSIPLGTLLFELIHRAKHNGLQAPKIRFMVNGSKIIIKEASEFSKNPGCLYVVGKEEDDSIYYGKITPEGVFIPFLRNYTKELGQLLIEFAKSPQEFAAKYGQETGSCCWCGRELTDNRSVAVGYGPICAEKYGLEWG